MNRRVSNAYSFIDEIFKFRWLIFGIILYFYGSRSKEQLFYFSVQTDLLINQWDLLFKFLSDIYLIIYVLLPILLYRSLSILISDFEYIILIRVGSYQNWVYQSLKKFLQTLSVIFVVWAVVILILLIGVLPFNGWSPFSELNASLSETQILAEYINNPFLALLLQLLLFTLSLICVHLILALIYVLSKRKWIVIFTAILIWLYSVSSFRLLPESAYLFDISNYLMLHWGVIGFGNVWSPFIIVVGIFIFLIWILRRIDLNQLFSKKLFNNWVYILFAIFIGIALWSGTQMKLSTTIWDEFIIIFIGSSQTGFSLKSFLSYFIIYVGFIYLIQLYLQRELKEIGYYKLLRYQSVNRWFWSWYRKIIVFIMLYLFILALFALSLSYLTGSSLSFYISVNDMITINEMFYHFFVNGYLQLHFYTLFVFIIAWLRNETFYSLVAISVLTIFMFPGLNTELILPVGLNSMGYVLNGVSIYDLSIVLSFWITIEILIVFYFFYKKDIDF